MAPFGVVRLSTGLGYFSLTFSPYDFRMLSRVFRLSLLWVVSAGSLAPAFAFADMGDGNALGENGGIAGGFFSSAPMTPAAVPLPLPAGGPDLCGPAIAGASASHDLPAGLLDAITVVESGRLNPRTGDLKPWPWTIDANGAGYAYATEQAAEQAGGVFERGRHRMGAVQPDRAGRCGGGAPWLAPATAMFTAMLAAVRTGGVAFGFLLRALPRQAEAVLACGFFRPRFFRACKILARFFDARFCARVAGLAAGRTVLGHAPSLSLSGCVDNQGRFEEREALKEGCPSG